MKLHTEGNESIDDLIALQNENKMKIDADDAADQTSVKTTGLQAQLFSLQNVFQVKKSSQHF